MRASLLVALVGFVLAVAACGTGTKDACEDYIDSYNDLECVTEALERSTFCTDDLDDACDLTAYYECLATAHSCTDGVLETDYSTCVEHQCS